MEDVNGDDELDNEHDDEVDGEEKQTETVALESTVDTEEREGGGEDTEDKGHDGDDSGVASVDEELVVLCVDRGADGDGADDEHDEGDCDDNALDKADGAAAHFY